MNHSKALFFGLVCLLLGILTGCHHNDEPDPTPNPQLATRTVLVYMVADNSMSAFDKDDIKEMKEGFGMVGVDPARHNLLVYVDDYSNNPTLYRIVQDATGLVTDEIVYEYPTDHDSSSPSVIKDVILRAKAECPAQSYGFVYWSHGEGWIPYPVPTKSVTPMAGIELKWIGIDNTRTNILELGATLKAGFGQKLSFLMLDACYMLSVETLYDLRDATDWVISSPTEIPGPGAPYNVLVPEMFDNSPEKGMVSSYYNFYASTYDETKYNTNLNWTGGVSIGAVKMSAMDNLAKVTKQVLASHQGVSLERLKASLLDYDKRNSSGTSYIGYFDLYRFMEQMLPASDFSTWKAAFDAAMTDFRTTPKNFSAFAGLFSMEGSKGLSVYLPVTEDGTSPRDVAYQNTAWYKDAGLSQLGW